MILKSIKLLYATIIVIIATGAITACGSSGSSTAGTQVQLSAAPAPSVVTAMPAGSKVFSNDLGDTVTLTKAYLVIASATIETSCDASFSAAMDHLLDILIPQAQAHTTTTPTSTGVPYVIDILGADNSAVSIGALSPAVADYCGVDLDIAAADADTRKLPADIDMVGKTLYIEASYSLAAGGSGNFTIDTGATLINRHLLLPALLMLSASNLDGDIDIGISYDTWFDAIDMAALASEVATSTNPSDTQVNQLLQNITTSMHHI